MFFPGKVSVLTKMDALVICQREYEHLGYREPGESYLSKIK